MFQFPIQKNKTNTNVPKQYKFLKFKTSFITDKKMMTSRDKDGEFLHLASSKNIQSLGVSLLLSIKSEESMKGKTEKTQERQGKGACYDH